MQKFRKKPVVIEAVQFTGNPTEIEAWMIGHGARDKFGVKNFGRVVLIHTLEGTMEAKVGDYIIRGVKGEFYPCKPDVFEATYEPAAEQKAETVVQDEQFEGLREAAMPLLAFLNKYYHPHAYAVVTEGRVQIVEGALSAPLPVRD